MGRARREGRCGRGPLSAQLPEDARRAEAGAAVARPSRCKGRLTCARCKVSFTSLKNDVRELRAESGLSQGQLAEALDVSRQTIISIEKGRYVPSLPLAIALARYFGKAV